MHDANAHACGACASRVNGTQCAWVGVGGKGARAALGAVCPRGLVLGTRLLGGDRLLNHIIQLVDRQLSVSILVNASDPLVDGLLERRDDAVAVRVRIEVGQVECLSLQHRRRLTGAAAGEDAEGAANGLNGMPA